MISYSLLLSTVPLLNVSAGAERQEEEEQEEEWAQLGLMLLNALAQLAGRG